MLTVQNPTSPVRRNMLTKIHPNISFDSKSGTIEERIRMLDCPWVSIFLLASLCSYSLLLLLLSLIPLLLLLLVHLVIQPLLISATTITTFDTSDTATSPSSDRAYARFHIWIIARHRSHRCFPKCPTSVKLSDYSHFSPPTTPETVALLYHKCFFVPSLNSFLEGEKQLLLVNIYCQYLSGDG